jgi:hypothetical protein
MIFEYALANLTLQHVLKLLVFYGRTQTIWIFPDFASLLKLSNDQTKQSEVVEKLVDCPPLNDVTLREFFRVCVSIYLNATQQRREGTIKWIISHKYT